jgi:superfamily I DNA/RNA helicase
VSAPDLAEESRLLFAGMTRARSRLFLLCRPAQQARHYGGGRAAKAPQERQYLLPTQY